MVKAGTFSTMAFFNGGTYYSNKQNSRRFHARGQDDISAVLGDAYPYASGSFG